MLPKVSVIVLVFGILVQINNFHQPYLYEQSLEITLRVTSCFQGLMFLVYPLLGHLADVCLNRYRTINLSFIPLICGQTTAILSLSALFVFLGFFYGYISWNLQDAWLLIIPVLGVLMSIIGTGMSEANIIQFGLDQLLEAPTHKLIAFIHWYYFCLAVGRLISYYLFTVYSIVEFYLHSQLKFLLKYLFPV